ncbi:MAG TPA: phenylalanine--tRNA ligase subunit alpha, partial [Deinococcales bacterium]|nr:phenylalanine--tRNA ligase subunit alpha [Deinococcales bacterium]
MRDEALSQIAAAADERQLQDLRVRFLGKKGEVTSQLKTLGSLPPDERRAAGARINALRDELENAFNERRTELRRAELDARLERERVDLTLPGDPFPTGGEHIITRVTG